MTNETNSEMLVPKTNSSTESEVKARNNNLNAVSINHKKNQMPEGMSKSQWKKELKKIRWEETKEDYRKKKREKRKAARVARRSRLSNEENTNHIEIDKNAHQQKLIKIRPEDQIETGVKIILDCEFDDLMNEKEITSLSNQITRAYSAKRHCKFSLDLSVTSFGGNLKNRFDTAVSQYTSWKGIRFLESTSLENLILNKELDIEKVVYLTADTDVVINELQADHTYVIGGIVDKNRHKNICRDKAEKLGLKMGRLPIDRFIKLNSRQVLATSHVFDICCKWFENEKDWGAAFNQVLPPRKISKATLNAENGSDDSESEESKTKIHDEDVKDGL